MDTSLNSTKTSSYDQDYADNGSYSQIYSTNLLIVIVILAVFAVVGAISNALVVAVFNRKDKKLTSTIFIITLAVVDLLTCLVVIPYTIYIEYANYVVKYDIFCKFYQFLITSNIPFSAIMMVIISVDRYLCICHPFTRVINTLRAKVLVTCMALFAAGIGCTVALMYGVYSSVPIQEDLLPYDKGNITLSYEEMVQYDLIYSGTCQTNNIYVSSLFSYYFNKFYCGLFVACFFVSITMYALIFRSVLSTRRQFTQQQISSSQKGNVRLALMLFVVNIVFIVTYLPAFLMSLSVIPYNIIVFYMYFANFVANPVIYCFFSKSFREGLKMQICCTTNSVVNKPSVGHVQTASCSV